MFREPNGGSQGRLLLVTLRLDTLQSGIKSTVTGSLSLSLSLSLCFARSRASVAGRLHVGTKLDKYHLDANDGTANVKPSLPVCRATSLGFGTRTSRTLEVTLIHGPQARSSADSFLGYD